MLDKVARYKDRFTAQVPVVHVSADGLVPDESLPTLLKWVLARMKDYNIGVCSNGTFVSGHTNMLVRQNTLICMLRYDYMDQKVGALSGRALNRALEIMLAGAVAATQKAQEAIPDLCKIEEIKVDFNTYEA